MQASSSHSLLSLYCSLIVPLSSLFVLPVLFSSSLWSLLVPHRLFLSSPVLFFPYPVPLSSCLFSPCLLSGLSMFLSVSSCPPLFSPCPLPVLSLLLPVSSVLSCSLLVFSLLSPFPSLFSPSRHQFSSYPPLFSSCSPLFTLFVFFLFFSLSSPLLTCLPCILC